MEQRRPAPLRMPVRTCRLEPNSARRDDYQTTATGFYVLANVFHPIGAEIMATGFNAIEYGGNQGIGRLLFLGVSNHNSQRPVSIVPCAFKFSIIATPGLTYELIHRVT